ncbi:MAG: hypothetical protein LQ345_000677 [Seirophora villosa]|nr:MAG: hypothetical protein LQ345_000677 [Seirophora villosa]
MAEEPSLLEYARYYGLSCDHLQVNPLELLPPPEDLSLESNEDSIWLHLHAGAASPPPDRLQAVKESSAFLAATDPKQYEGCDFEGFDPLPRFRRPNHKLELPLLRTDHEVDMLEFVRRTDPNLAEEFFPFEKVKDELDEGLGWPSKCHAWPEMFFQRVQNERIEVPKGVLEYMRSVLDIRTWDEEPTFEHEMPVYVRNKLRDPITPPLLPRSPTPQPYEPSSETGRLELLSEHSSPTRHQAESLERILQENEMLIPAKRRKEANDDDTEVESMLDLRDVGEIYSPLKDIHRTPSPPPLKRSRRQDLKVEGPLTPPATDQPPPWNSKKVSLGEALQDLIPNLPPPIPEPEQLSTEDIDILFAEHIAPLAAKAERAIEQEQLQEADTTSRVLVPIMDFSKPTPPWQIAPSKTIDDWKKGFMQDVKGTYLDSTPWLQGDQTKKGLSWVPFPMSLGRFELQETIEDDGSLAAYITDPEPMDPDTLTWKPPGLRVFDENYVSDEEELERGTFPPPGDVRSLIKERILEIQRDDEGDHATSYATEPVDGNPQSRKERLLPQRDQAKHSAPNPEFSAMDSLDRFLGIRKGELRPKEKSAQNHPPTVAPKTSRAALDAGGSTSYNVVEKPMSNPPLPKLTIPEKPRYYVASTSFLSDRRLAHRVRDLYPSAVFIERDFALYSLYSEPMEKKMRLVRTGPEAPPDEADLVLSPNTGLMLTGLQKIKQQSLPGQTTRSPVRERIGRIAARYERLIVVVSCTGLSSESHAGSGCHLEESDCEALVSLSAFLNHLQALSESELILIDDDTTVVATWIISLMIKYSWEGPVELLQEETQWEVFLRQAGMNAFAAQVVVGVMKTAQGGDGGLWGLRNLVSMYGQERYQSLEGFLGGRRMLERIGRVLDARW